MDTSVHKLSKKIKTYMENDSELTLKRKLRYLFKNNFKIIKVSNC